MELYAAYIKERDGQELVMLPDNKGWYTYKMQEEKCLICDIYIVPEERCKGWAKKIAQELVSQHKEVYGMTCPHTKTWEQSHAVLIKTGFVPVSKDDNLIYYKYTENQDG